MKWFKHMTDASTDEKLSRLIEDLGGLGYGRWWRLVELIAAQMDHSDKCDIAYRPSVITRALWFRSAIDCQSFLDRLAIDRLLVTDLTANEWRLTCPKLLEIRARKKLIGNKNVHKEVEVEVEVEVDNPIVPLPRDILYSDCFKRFWDNYPLKRGKDAAWRCWKNKKLDALADEIISSVAAHKKTRQWEEGGGKFIPHPSTFLNQGRWKDELEPRLVLEEVND